MLTYAQVLAAHMLNPTREILKTLTYEQIWDEQVRRHPDVPEAELRRIHQKWKDLAAWIEAPKGKAPEDRGGGRR